MRNRYDDGMTTPNNPRIALGCFMLESNAHSPVATREEFAQNYLEFGDAMMRDWQSEHYRREMGDFTRRWNDVGTHFGGEQHGQPLLVACGIRGERVLGLSRNSLHTGN